MAPPEPFTLTFADEFDGMEGTPPNLEIWRFDVGTGDDGWGNQELQTYTANPENIAHDGMGHLRIRAIQTDAGGFTSARIRSQGTFEQRYGRFEARIRVPAGRGLWPAFWMLGNTFPDENSTPEEVLQGMWPLCGEIDIMEIRGEEPDVVLGSIHGPGYSGPQAVTEAFRLPAGESFADDFHVFAVEWDPGRITWFVDGNLYHTQTVGSVRGLAPTPGSTDPEWVFFRPFFLILNLAVGGTFVDEPDDTTPFPSELLIDYVRVYARNQ